MEAHSPLDPAVNGALLVEREIVAGPRAQQEDNLLQAALIRIRQVQVGPGNQDRDVVEIGDDLDCQLLRRAHHVGQPGINGTAGHAVELGGFWRLHKDRAGFLLDGAQA